MSVPRSGFDKLAGPYRWLEYATLGRALERCRFHFLPQLLSSHHALLLGDGDGRFAARLRQTSPTTQITAVDGSAAMLRSLARRCGGTHVRTIHADLRHGLPEACSSQRYDLIATHFLLDCLSTSEVETLARSVQTVATEGTQWVVSEFAVPAEGLKQGIARAVVRSLYAAFQVLTGLEVKTLPDFRSALRSTGWTLQQSQSSLGGLLVSELWTTAGAVPHHNEI